MRNKIKTSLDVARTQRVSCKTTRIEEQIKKDLLGTRGSFLTANDVEKIVQKEDKRKKKQARAIAKARVNLLRQKERIKTIQAARTGKLNPKTGAAIPAATVKKVTGQKRNFHAIDVSY
jgi:hypothetical protein